MSQARETFEEALPRFSLEREYRIVRKDGKIRWISNAEMLKYDSKGELISYEGVIKDVTELRQAESRERLARDLLDAQQHAVTMQWPQRNGL